jgi:hypothetical protein
MGSKLKMADDVLVRVPAVASDEAIRMLAAAADELDELRYRDGFSVDVSMQDDELARLQDELETRRDALRRRWSELLPKQN